MTMIRTPLFPFYSRAQKLVKFLDGKKVEFFTLMWNTIWELRGTPQETVDWQNPDEWIPERLSGKPEIKNFTLELWNSTNKTVNPRYVRGIQFLINNYDLVRIVDDHYEITERGVQFCDRDDNTVIGEIDHEEGCDYVLYLCSIKKNSSIKAFYQDWENYSIRNSNNRKESVFKDSLRRRLRNLIDRALVVRDGTKYNITEKGQGYLTTFEQQIAAAVSEEKRLHEAVEKFSDHQREKLKQYLHVLTPTQFEYLVKELLDAMGYEDVAVTAPSNDKGVDVVGKIQKGISKVTEVVQVKRFTSNIQRSVLDQLRGSLHRFDAFQGTIITLSDFAKGTKQTALERGAAPITLINGEKLIDLLVDNEITVKKRALEYFMVDEDYFTTSQEDEE